jgi:NADP-dependent 3-hydroxy acid dehydrogenase YdfG
VLVNNAGIGIFKNAADMSPAEWQSIVDTNLSGVFYYCHAAIPHLRRRGGGWILNISSLAATNPFTGGAAYCASKAGLNAFTEALMQEVRYDNIRVTYVMPGSVATGFSGRGEPGKADWKVQPEDIAQMVLDLLAMPPRSLPSRVEMRPSKPQKK